MHFFVYLHKQYKYMIVKYYEKHRFVTPISYTREQKIDDSISEEVNVL